MRTIQMTLDHELAERVDRVTRELKTSRSAFTRQALSDALDRLHIRRAEEKHREGYQTHPVQPGEFSVWEDEQEWGD